MNGLLFEVPETKPVFVHFIIKNEDYELRATLYENIFIGVSEEGENVLIKKIKENLFQKINRIEQC